MFFIFKLGGDYMRLMNVVTVSIVTFLGVMFYSNTSVAYTLHNSPSLAKECISGSSMYVKCSDNTNVTDPTQA